MIMLAFPNELSEPDLLLVAGLGCGPARNLGHQARPADNHTDLNLSLPPGIVPALRPTSQADPQLV